MGDLIIVQKLNPEMLYRQVQLLIEESDWVNQGEEIVPGGGPE